MSFYPPLWQAPRFLPQGQQAPRETPLPLLELEPWAENVESFRLKIRPLLSGSAGGLSASAMGRMSSMVAPSSSQMYS